MSKRRIKKARIEFVSLVPQGANKLSVLFKADDAFTATTLLKEGADFDAKGELTAIVYTPGYRDSQGDVAEAVVVKEMCHSFLRDGDARLNLRHDGKPIAKERAAVVENFVVQKGDPRFAELRDYDGNKVDAEGAWAFVVKIDDPELRKLYKSGGWRGVSLEGRAEFEVEKAMVTTEEVQKLIEAALAKAAPKEPEKVEKKKDVGPPEFKGDPLNKKDLAAHVAALKRHKAIQAIDFTSIESLEAAIGTDATTKEDPSVAVEKLKKEKADVEAKLAKLEGASNVPPAAGAAPAQSEHERLVKKGLEIAEAAKRQNAKK